MNNIKEEVRNFWNNQPCNIKHSSKKYLSKEYFDEIESKRYFVEPHSYNFPNFEKWNGKKVLEIGCGIGTDSINFVRNGAILTIVDFSDKSLEICKKRFEVYNLKAKFICCDVEMLDEFLELQTFDLIYSFGVIHHTPNPEKAFEQIQKYMNDDSELRIMLYSKISFKLFSIMMENKIKKIDNIQNLVRKNAEAQYDCPVAYTYTFDEIKNMVEKYNIKIEKIWKDHIFIYNIPEYKKNIYIRNEYWDNVDDKLLEQFKKELGWHTMVICKKM